MERDKAFASSKEAHELAARCATLLRTRYSRSATPFWKASLEVFKVLQRSRPANAQVAAAWIADCNEVLMSSAAEEPEAAARPEQHTPYFEGQLSSHETTPAEPSQMQVLMQRLAEYSQAQQADDNSAPDAQSQPQANLSQDDLLQLREELETTLMLALSEEDVQPSQRPAPPASRAFVRMLPKEQLTSERLQQLGGSDLPCSICRQELELGTWVQIMPCKHVFHPPCLAPWLSVRNSCPICRHELPTDDSAYERDKQAALDAKQAENALSHQEFLYT
ncbi:hypothetical protein WJX73_002830 [Symbiochloris irregularis]|uniref:RING-type E3 ubiquitin transferase n=1 Tax=Symbiochloris irregularis TaxID=706552 RepID=A0AAW1NY48_9CHLO